MPQTAGVYCFYVKQYSKKGSLAKSSAVVRVYTHSGKVKKFVLGKVARPRPRPRPRPRCSQFGHDTRNGRDDRLLPLEELHQFLNPTVGAEACGSVYEPAAEPSFLSHEYPAARVARRTPTARAPIWRCPGGARLGSETTPFFPMPPPRGHPSVAPPPPPPPPPDHKQQKKKVGKVWGQFGRGRTWAAVRIANGKVGSGASCSKVFKPRKAAPITRRNTQRRRRALCYSLGDPHVKPFTGNRPVTSVSYFYNILAIITDMPMVAAVCRSTGRMETCAQTCA